MYLGYGAILFGFHYDNSYYARRNIRRSSEIICLLVICLDDTKSSDVEICHKAMKALSAIGVYTTDLLYLIVPTICEAICYAQTLNEVRVVAMEELTNLAKTTDIFPSIGTVIRAITFGIGSEEQEMSLLES